MALAAKSSRRISSPAATGGAGTFFEQHVDAYWLGLLLVRAIPPILIDSTVVEVHFQADASVGTRTISWLLARTAPEFAESCLAR